MNKENKQERYASPEIKVKEVNAMRLMCSSITGMESGYEQNDSTF